MSMLLRIFLPDVTLLWLEGEPLLDKRKCKCIEVQSLSVITPPWLLDLDHLVPGSCGSDLF